MRGAGGSGRQRQGPGISRGRPEGSKRPFQEQNLRGAAPNKRQQTGSGRRFAEEADEQYRRALARMEMGPDDMASDSELDSLEEEEDVQVQPLSRHQPAQPATKKATATAKQAASGNGYLIGPASSDDDGDDALEEEEESEQDALDVDSEDDDSAGGSEGASSEEEDDDDDLPVEKSARRAALPGQGRPGSGIPTGVVSDDSEGSDEDDEDDEEEAAGARPGAGSEDDSDDDDNDSEASDEDDEALQQLAELPLETRLALLRDGTGPRGEVAKAAAKEAKIQEQSFKRVNKHRPQEMSSKKPVSRFKQVVEPIRKASKDPRFAPMRHDKEKEAAARRYAFLYDDVMTRERNELNARAKNEKNPSRRAALTSQLQRVQQALSNETQRRARSDLENKIKYQQREAAESGKKPFFLKESDKKKLELVAKYEALKSKGQLARYMEKRRKHNASKDHRYLPSNRREEGGQ